MSSKKSNPTSREVHACMQQLFSDTAFYNALCQSVQEYREMRFIPIWDRAKTVSVRWIDALCLLRLFGDTPEGEEGSETRVESMNIRSAFMKQLLGISPRSLPDGFVVIFRAMSVQVRIKVLCSGIVGRWDMRIFIEDFPS